VSGYVPAFRLTEIRLIVVVLEKITVGPFACHILSVGLGGTEQQKTEAFSSKPLTTLPYNNNTCSCNASVSI